MGVGFSPTYFLIDEVRKDYDKILEERGHIVDWENALSFLMHLHQKQTGKRVIVLLDEYDTPIHALPGIWCHDTANNKQERVYHAFVLGLLTHLNDHYLIRSNRESGEYDLHLM
jgi:hypothetical protein